MLYSFYISAVIEKNIKFMNINLNYSLFFPFSLLNFLKSVLLNLPAFILAFYFDIFKEEEVGVFFLLVSLFISFCVLFPFCITSFKIVKEDTSVS